MSSRLPVFVSDAEFRFAAPNASSLPPERGRRGVPYVTASAGFHLEVVRKRPGVMRELGSLQLASLPVEGWAGADYRGRALLLLAPPPAIGEHVAIRLFLERFAARGARRIGLLGTDAATDVYAGLAGVELFPLWLARERLVEFDMVIDLNHVPGRRNITYWPVDMEAELLRLFGFEPEPPEPPEPPPPVRPRGARLRVGLFPLASSPMRTLPPALVAELAGALGEIAEVTVALNPHQAQTKHLRRALGERIRHVDRIGSIGELRKLMAAVDYGVFADSGPAHLSKLDRMPGAAIYSSAPASVLQGRHRNLLAIQSDYAGPYCRAPCGLAKLRQAPDGAIGCMASLARPVEELGDVRGRDDALLEKLLLNSPIPCLNRLAEEAPAVARRVREDLESRLSSDA